MKEKKPVTRLDYVEFYAEKMKEDNKFFKQHKMLIESQMKSSKAIFKNMFKDAKNQEEFQKQAREYLKKLGILKSVSND